MFEDIDERLRRVVLELPVDRQLARVESSLRPRAAVVEEDVLIRGRRYLVTPPCSLDEARHLLTQTSVLSSTGASVGLAPTLASRPSKVIGAGQIVELIDTVAEDLDQGTNVALGFECPLCLRP